MDPSIEVEELCKENEQLRKENASLKRDRERAERAVKGIKNEADGYRRDFLKCNDWCCENRGGYEFDNPVDRVLSELNKAQASIKSLKQFSETITNYLFSGGLVNPEHANHNEVSRLLWDIRDAIDTAQGKDGVK